MYEGHVGYMPLKSEGPSLQFGRDIVRAKKVLSSTFWCVNPTTAEVVMEALFATKMAANTPMLLPHATPYMYGLVGPPLALINGIDGAHGHAHCHPSVAAR